MRLIDADALIVTNDGCQETTCRRCKNHITNCEELKDLIRNAPTIEPERKNGEWSTKNGELAIWDVCSECGRMVIHKAPFYNFCPNCGADMRGEKDE